MQPACARSNSTDAHRSKTGRQRSSAATPLLRQPTARCSYCQSDGRLMLDRPESLRLIDAAFADQPLVLTLGGTIREMLAAVGRKPNHLSCLDAMGQPVAIGLGLALGTSRRVVVVEGDGSLLMGFS